jgi:hypothetical protein
MDYPPNLIFYNKIIPKNIDKIKLAQFGKKIAMGAKNRNYGR